MPLRLPTPSTLRDDSSGHCIGPRRRVLSGGFHALYDKVPRGHLGASVGGGTRERWGLPGLMGRPSKAVERPWGRGVPGGTGDRTGVRAGYRPRAVRRVADPEGRREAATTGDPDGAGSVVQAAAKLVLEPIFEADFRDSSYGFRPKRSAHQAVERVRQG